MVYKVAGIGETQCHLQIIFSLLLSWVLRKHNVHAFLFRKRNPEEFLQKARDGLRERGEPHFRELRNGWRSIRIGASYERKKERAQICLGG